MAAYLTSPVGLRPGPGCLIGPRLRFQVWNPMGAPCLRHRIRGYPEDRGARFRPRPTEEWPMARVSDFSHIPIIDVSELVTRGPARQAVSERLGEACRESGFF